MNSGKMLEYEMLKFIQTFKFYSAILQRLERCWDSNCPSAGVYQNGNKLYLHINKEWFESLPESDRLAVLLHEVLHLVFNHTGRYKKSTYFKNIALDLVINQHLGATEGFKGVSEEFKRDIAIIEKFEFPEDRTAPEYAMMLRNKFEKNKQKKSSKSTKQEKGGGTGQGGGGKPSSEEQKKDQESSQGGNKQEQEVPQDRRDRNSHQYTPDGYTEVEAIRDQMVKRLVDEAVKHVQGNIPGNLEEYIQQLLAPAKIPWHQYLRQFVGYSKKVRRTSTRFKPNRRFGISFPGRKYENMNRLLVVLDTSGSISEEMLQYFFSELLAICKKEIEVIVAEVDYDLQHTYTVDKLTDIQYKVHGRGGTRFDPGFEYAVKHRIKDVVYFTDLEGSVRDKWGSLVRTLWVVPKEKNIRRMPFGKVISIEDE